MRVCNILVLVSVYQVQGLILYLFHMEFGSCPPHLCARMVCEVSAFPGPRRLLELPMTLSSHFSLWRVFLISLSAHSIQTSLLS
jgi:hypothetical protein